MEHYFRYIPVRRRDVCWGLYVTAAGSTSIPPGAPYPPLGHPKPYRFSRTQGHTIPDYMASYVVRGKGVFEPKATGARPIVPGTCFVVFPGQWHRYRPLREVGWDSYWVSFRGENMDRLVSHGFFSPDHAVLLVGSDKLIPTLFERLVSRLNRQQTVLFGPTLDSAISDDDPVRLFDEVLAGLDWSCCAAHYDGTRGAGL